MKNNDIPELRNMGPKLVIVRRNSGKSQEKFAADYGVTQGTMSKYENGHTKLPVELMARICKDYTLNPNYFFDWDVETRKKLELPPNFLFEPERIVAFVGKCIEVALGEDDAKKDQLIAILFR